MSKTYKPAPKVKRQCQRRGCLVLFEGRSDKKYCSPACAKAVQEEQNRLAYEELKASWNEGEPKPRECVECGGTFLPEKVLQRKCGKCTGE